MFSVLRLPGIQGKLLDRFLSQGWYRYGAAIFTTDHIETEGLSTPVIWIRFRIRPINQFGQAVMVVGWYTFAMEPLHSFTNKETARYKQLPATRVVSELRA
jgi:hypothetical protein